MSQTFYSEAVAARLGLRRSFLAIFALSLFVNLFLSLSLLFFKPSVETILVPMPYEGETFRFNEKGPSVNYLEKVTLLSLAQLLNVTPQTVYHNIDDFLKMVLPSAFERISAQLMSEAKLIESSRTSSLFYPEKTTVFPEKLRVRVEGIHKVVIGSVVTSETRKHYEMQFHYQAGRLFIVSFKEVQP